MKMKVNNDLFFSIGTFFQNLIYFSKGAGRGSMQEERL